MPPDKGSGLEIIMKVTEIIGGTVELIIKIAAFVFIVMFIFRTATTAYDYGYRVFAEEPMTEGEGRTISIYVEETASVKEIGEMLQEKGLIRDANLFVIQELLSESHDKIQPGIYDLNTSMTSQEMLTVMAAATEEVEELPGTRVPSVEEITGISNNPDLSSEGGDGEESDSADETEGEEGDPADETQGEDTGE